MCKRKRYSICLVLLFCALIISPKSVDNSSGVNFISKFHKEYFACLLSDSSSYSRSVLEAYCTPSLYNRIDHANDTSYTLDFDPLLCGQDCTREMIENYLVSYDTSMNLYSVCFSSIDDEGIRMWIGLKYERNNLLINSVYIVHDIFNSSFEINSDTLLFSEIEDEPLYTCPEIL